ncbi:MAG: thiamine phosphate synthase, partial [Planctomycetes bacterium]|nr:thiamine phosphate synthase [Planctomycetota bacterium]
VELWVSEDVALARALGATGVHLAERSPPPATFAATGLALGVSLHRPVSRGVADLALCRHAFLAPLFRTPSKPESAPLRPDGFLALAAGLPPALRCFALGGITVERLPELARHGIRHVAAIRLFFDAGDPARVAAVVRERLAPAAGGAASSGTAEERR